MNKGQGNRQEPLPLVILTAEGLNRQEKPLHVKRKYKEAFES